jgi:hypothetical protein
MDNPHRFHSAVPLAPLVLSLLLGCIPQAKDVGDDVLDTGDPTDTDTGEALDPTALEWSYVLPAETAIPRITGMADGGVAAIELRYEPYGQWVTRYAPDGAVLWQVDLGSQWLHSIATLPDGRLVLGGTVEQGGLRATLWRLSSAGVVEAMHVHPLPGDSASNASVSDIAVSSTGLAYLVNNSGIDVGTPAGELWWDDFELAPQWSWTGFPGHVAAVAVMPAGEIHTLEQHSSEDGTDLMRAFTAAGAPAGEQVVPRSRFADDQPLVRIEDMDDGGVRLLGEGGTSTLDMLLPTHPLLTHPRIVTHGHGVAIVDVIDHDELTLLQLDADGLEIRSLVRPALAMNTVSPSDVVIAPDGSVYVSGYELDRTDPSPIMHGFILKLPPPQ